MSDCTQLEPILTPYVDGEATAAERRLVEQHLRVCPPCYSRVAAERAVHDLIHHHRSSLTAECPSPALRTRCAELKVERDAPTGRARAAWPARLMPLALAASLVTIVGGAFLYEATEQSNRVMAAELVADHVKCFGMNRMLGTHEDSSTVESAMLGGFGWHMQWPQQLQRLGLELVGSRPCLYGGGKVAHLMYRHEGRPVSIFMLPEAVRAEDLIEVLGHEAAIWSVSGRTFVLVAKEPRPDVQRMASVVQASLR